MRIPVIPSWFCAAAAAVLTGHPAIAQTTAAPRVAVVDDVRPTLEQIFVPPRLLGTRPQGATISADGEWVLYRRALSDSDKPENETFLVKSAGGEPKRLFDGKTNVRAFWSRRGSELFVVRDGWLESHLVAADGNVTVKPIFEIGSRGGEVFQFRDDKRIAFQAGDNAQLYILDLEDGSRRTPISDLKNRAQWFRVLPDEQRLAVFADPSNSGKDGPKESPAEPAKGKPDASDSDDPEGEKPDERGGRASPQKRVLYLVKLDGSEPPKETKFEEGGQVQLSPTGGFALRERFDRADPRQLIIADFLSETVSTMPVRSSLPGDHAAKVDFDLFDLNAGKSLDLPLDAGSRYWTANAVFAECADVLLFDRVSDDFHVRQLLLANLTTKTTTLVHSERDEAWIGGPTQFADLSADGSIVYFTSEDGGYNLLYRISANGKDRRCLTPPAKPGDRGEVAEIDRLEHSDRFLIGHNQSDPANYAIDLVDGASATRRTLTSTEGVAESPQANIRGTRLVYRQQFLGVPAEFYSVSLEAPAAPVRLTTTQPPELAALGLSPPEVIEYENKADGTKVRAFLYKPPGFDPAKKYPLVIFVHGAGYLQQVKRSMTSYEPNYLFHQRLARKGYVVLDPDYRHSQGYGRKFRTDIYGFMGGKDLDDVVAGIDFLAEKGIVDKERVGVYGGSYGGFMTLMALFTKPDRFAAGCALRSVTDWRTYNSWYTNARLGDPKKDPENYQRSSPIDHADGLKKPLLLLHGLKDSNVFVQDTIRLVEALIKLRKDSFEVMLYPSQDHGFTDKDSWLDEYRRIERFFDQHLTGRSY